MPGIPCVRRLDRPAEAVAAGTDPMVFTSLAMRLLEDIKFYYDVHTKGGRLTDKKLLAFVKGVRRNDAVTAMVGMVTFIDKYGGKMHERYARGTINGIAERPEKLRMEEYEKLQKRMHGTSVWNEITTALAEERRKQVSNEHESIQLGEGA